MTSRCIEIVSWHLDVETAKIHVLCRVSKLSSLFQLFADTVFSSLIVHTCQWAMSLPVNSCSIIGYTKTFVTFIQGYASGYCHNLVIAIVPILFSYLWQHCNKNSENMGNKSQWQWPSNTLQTDYFTVLLPQIQEVYWHYRNSKIMAVTRCTTLPKTTLDLLTHNMISDVSRCSTS